MSRKIHEVRTVLAYSSKKDRDDFVKGTPTHYMSQSGYRESIYASELSRIEKQKLESLKDVKR